MNLEKTFNPKKEDMEDSDVIENYINHMYGTKWIYAEG